MDKICNICNVSLAKKVRSLYRHVGDNMFQCVKCYRKSHRDQTHPVQNIVSNNFDHLTETIILPINGYSMCHTKCIFGCNSEEIKRLSKEECASFYAQTGIMIKYGSRLCTVHKENDEFIIPDEFAPCNNNIQFTITELVAYLETMKDMINNKNKKKAKHPFLDLTDSALVFETGLTQEQFRTLLSYFENEPIKVHDISLALGLFMSRLRRAYTFEELSLRYNVTRKTVSKYFEICRSILMKSFCSTYLSLKRDRADMISHQTERARRLHNAEGNHIVLILDGTYLFIQKSMNFEFQRITYSGYKHRNLIKPFMVVYPDGYIADVFGPYAGNTNDASIMIELLKKKHMVIFPGWGYFSC